MSVTKTNNLIHAEPNADEYNKIRKQISIGKLKAFSDLKPPLKPNIAKKMKRRHSRVARWKNAIITAWIYLRVLLVLGYHERSIRKYNKKGCRTRASKFPGPTWPFLCEMNANVGSCWPTKVPLACSLLSVPHALT